MANLEREKSDGAPDRTGQVSVRPPENRQAYVQIGEMDAICVFSYLSIDALAGKTTILNAVSKYATGNRLAAILPWLTAICLLFWALRTCAAATKNGGDARTHSQTRSLVRSCPNWNQPASGRSNQPEGRIRC